MAKICTWNLYKTFSNKTSFVALNRTIRMILGGRDPFRANDIYIRRMGNKVTGLIRTKIVDFFLHGYKPFRRLSSYLKPRGSDDAERAKRRDVVAISIE